MSEKVLMKGNEAVAEAAIIADCRHYFGYPITPQNEIGAYMAKRMPKVNGTFLQAESEIAAINMVIGASAAGKRTMTSSSSPGISLKSEGLSYLAGCDLPAVIVNVQRGGPGLGSIQPAQSDYLQATHSAGHGDFHMLSLAPYSVQEMFDLTYQAFVLADRYRITVMVLTDAILGQIMEPVVIAPPKSESTLATKNWAVTGTEKKRPKNIVNSLFLQPEELERSNKKRYEKYALIEEKEVRYQTYLVDDAETVIVSYGACARVAKNAIDQLRQAGIKAGLFRPISLWPFPKKALLSISEHTKTFLAVEMSMGQMVEDIELAIRCSRPVELYCRVGGMVPTPEEIVDKVKEIHSNNRGKNGRNV